MKALWLQLDELLKATISTSLFRAERQSRRNGGSIKCERPGAGFGWAA
jgi:hypothetical protein